MPKLRNGSSEIGKFTQWLGRKCRNHNPLEELSLKKRRDGSGVFLTRKGKTAQVGAVAKVPDRYKARSKGNMSVLEEDDGVLLYEFGERCFEITVREVEPEEYAEKARVAVGY
ncbi:hypothetical protein [Nitratireductor sp. OM-1]|uniref:hypothetical protein n=1 Tax=Nitratireductor sp. OM-1 TaxID=1756988 RepID=UPI000DE17F28|nr:hypothetical protein [Nitratireductor sp. OM-1]